MNAHWAIRLILFGMALLFIVGCSGGKSSSPVPTSPPSGNAVVSEAAAQKGMPQPTAPPNPTAAPTSAVETVTRDDAALPVAARPNRIIIKNAEMQLLVADSDSAIDRITQVASDLRGYIISSRVWYQEWQGVNYKYASVTLGVPVDAFETALRRLRQLALRVLDETAAGQDVTDEYVDLQSRVRNLEATRDRIREFLAQAKTVEESLQVNAQLAEVEAEIEKVQGRLNYLGDRGSYSTITIQVNPELPPTPTPVPTFTPTPTPTPTPITPWSPLQTAQAATTTLGSMLRILIDFIIWIVIILGPFLIPAVILAFWFTRRPVKR